MKEKKTENLHRTYGKCVQKGESKILRFSFLWKKLCNIYDELKEKPKENKRI